MAGSQTTSSRTRITVLAGGVGAARFLRGLSSLTDPRQLTIVVNTGDDETFFGLYVSPDIDTVLYTLAGLVDDRQGWGRKRDSFTCLEALAQLYPEAWFRLGDRDLATHIFRTQQLADGATLSSITAALARAFGVEARVVPMSDAPVRTMVTVAGAGALAFQQYLVRDRGAGKVERIDIRAVRKAAPAPGVLNALRRADLILLPPSNPFVSIGPILQLPGVRATIRATRAPVVAISPLIGSRPVKGPLHRMLAGLGHEVSAVGVARLYRDFVDVFVLDRQDEKLAPAIEQLGMRPLVLDTLMSTPAKSRRLARAILERDG